MSQPDGDPYTDDDTLQDLSPATPHTEEAPERPRRAYLPWLVTALLLLSAIGFAVANQMIPPEQPEAIPEKLPTVEARTVQPSDYRETLTLPARLMADAEGAVSCELAGTLAKWLVPEDAQVTAGQVVAQVDTTTLDAQLAELQAAAAATQAEQAVVQAGVRRAEVAREQAKQRREALAVDLEAVRADAAVASRELARMEELLADDLATESELDTARNRKKQAELAVRRVQERIRQAETAVAEAEVAVAEAKARVKSMAADLESTRAAIASMRTRIAKATLRAPIGGTLEAHLVEPGEVISPGQPVGRVFDQAHLRAEVEVADRYIALFTDNEELLARYLAASMPGAEPSRRARVEIPGMPRLTGGERAGMQLDARIARVDRAADPASNTFTVELRLPNPGGVLRQGMIVRAHIDLLRYPRALVVPLAALHVTDAGPRVFVLEADADREAPIAAVREVEAVSIRETNVLVHGQLKPGDRLVVAGGQDLVSGMAVRVIKMDGQFAAAN